MSNIECWISDVECFKNRRSLDLLETSHIRYSKFEMYIEWQMSNIGWRMANIGWRISDVSKSKVI
jgi:hypothetical protein